MLLAAPLEPTTLAERHSAQSALNRHRSRVLPPNTAFEPCSRRTLLHALRSCSRVCHRFSHYFHPTTLASPPILPRLPQQPNPRWLSLLIPKFHLALTLIIEPHCCYVSKRSCIFECLVVVVHPLVIKSSRPRVRPSCTAPD